MRAQDRGAMGPRLAPIVRGALRATSRWLAPAAALGVALPHLCSCGNRRPCCCCRGCVRGGRSRGLPLVTPAARCACRWCLGCPSRCRCRCRSRPASCRCRWTGSRAASCRRPTVAGSRRRCAAMRRLRWWWSGGVRGGGVSHSRNPGVQVAPLQWSKHSPRPNAPVNGGRRTVPSTTIRTSPLHGCVGPLLAGSWPAATLSPRRHAATPSQRCASAARPRASMFPDQSSLHRVLGVGQRNNDTTLGNPVLGRNP